MIHHREDPTTVPFYDVFYGLNIMKSGQHHPDGMLWVRTVDRDHAVYHEKISLTSVAPGILEMFGIAAPDYMSASFQTLGMKMESSVQELPVITHI